MSSQAPALRFNGWGREEQAVVLSPAREAFMLSQLTRRIGKPLSPPPAALSLAEIELPSGALPEQALAQLRKACGDEQVRTDKDCRATHALGRSLPDLLRLRSGQIAAAPDAVVFPQSEDAVAAVLRVAEEARIAVVPFGGGTSVVGGVEACVAPGQIGALALDMAHLNRVLEIDAEAGRARFEAGIQGPALEAALASNGLTLGHFPQSFEHSTLGGWIAARGSGQQSDAYGGIERLLVSLRLATPRGVIRTLSVPRSAAGPDLNEIALGSEGTLGVIVDATVRVAPAPTHCDERGMLFRRFSDGVAAVREIVRSRLPVSLLRLSDANETAVGELQRSDPDRAFDPVAAVLSLLGRAGYAAEQRCMLLYGVEGSDARDVKSAVRRVRGIARKHGGAPLTRAPGKSWRRGRYHAPYMRDWLLDRGVAVDTFETAISWAELERMHVAVCSALARAAEQHAGGGITMAHLSHSYLDGACLYFTVLYPLDAPRGLEQWAAIKREVTQAIVDHGGTVSHHHGVGRDHSEWLESEKGALGLEVLSAVKRTLDPGGIMNPGKLLP